MEPPRTKRQKVAIACDTCRSRKIKCDGQQPVCEPCRKKSSTGATCIWNHGGNRMAQPLTGSVQWTNLRPRLQSTVFCAQDEQRHQSRAADQRHDSQTATARHALSAADSVQSAFRSAEISQSPKSPFTLDARSTDLAGGRANALMQAQDTAQRPEEVSPSEHSVHAIIGAALDEDSREGFFGDSSAGTFMQNVKKMVQRKVGDMSGGPASNQHVHKQTSPASGHSTVQSKALDYVLPSRRRADILMSCYWRYVHVLYPFLDKMQVEEDYEKLWRREGSIAGERSYMCLINAIFALSSQLDESTPMEGRQQLAYVFYARARELLDIVETGSVRSVQTFLLLGQYYQSTSEPHPCWIFTGLAIRTAQSLGLNLPETSGCAADDRTRELFRKLWHGCVLMDRAVSMTYGRPCMIGPKAATAVPLPLAIYEEYLVPDSPQEQLARTQQTLAVEFFVLSLKLYDIMHDIIFNFYSVNHQSFQPLDDSFGALEPGQVSVLEIERRLSKWANSVPDRLRVSTGNKPRCGTVEPTLYRQAIILNQRQLHIRILLLRPVLSNFIAFEFYDGDQSVPLDSLLSHAIQRQCAIVCVKVALEAIDTIRQERSRSVGEVGYCAAWWYNVLYLYTSATVLIAARLSPAILADISDQLVLDGWQKAIEILEEYSAVGASIQRLVTTLRLLFEAVPQQYSRFKENSRKPRWDMPSVTRNQIQGTVSSPSWRPLDTVDAFSTPQDDLTRAFQNENDALPVDSFSVFATDFDPNDLSWLTTIPLDD